MYSTEDFVKARINDTLSHMLATNPTKRTNAAFMCAVYADACALARRKAIEDRVLRQVHGGHAKLLLWGTLALSSRQYEHVHTSNINDTCASLSSLVFAVGSASKMGCSRGSTRSRSKNAWSHNAAM